MFLSTRRLAYAESRRPGQKNERAEPVARANAHHWSFFEDHLAIRAGVPQSGERGSSLTFGHTAPCSMLASSKLRQRDAYSEGSPRKPAVATRQRLLHAERKRTSYV